MKIAVSRSFLDLAPAERNRIDILLVDGGAGVERAIQDRPLIAVIREIWPRRYRHCEEHHDEAIQKGRRS